MSTLYFRPATPARTAGFLAVPPVASTAGFLVVPPVASTAGFTPAAEIVRDGEDAVVRVELPGVNVADDVTVEVDRGRLVVRGERRDERTEEQAGRSLREVRYGAFRRTFRLPEGVTAESVTASYDAGVLSVRVAGAHAGTEARKVEITTGAPAAGTETPEVEAAA